MNCFKLGRKNDFLYVALGGAVGAILIGFIVGFIGDRDETSKNTLLFWKTGVCGGFTTFSTFSLEAADLWERKSYLSGGCYIVLSVLGCIIGVYWGKKIAMMLQR